VSLINRMLRDLSSRQPQPGNVMSGIQLPPAASAPGRSVLGRLAALTVLVAALTAGLWWVFGPRPVNIPQPRAAPPGAQIATEPTPAPAEPPPLIASAPAPAAEPARLQMDTQLSAAAAPPPPAAEPKPEPPPRTARPRKAPASVPTAPEVATAAPASPARAAERYADARRALERGDTAGAEVALVDALTLDPKLHAAREDLGNLHLRQGRLEDAESAARAGLELEPTWAGYRRMVARIELARGRPAGAVEALENNPPPVERDAEYHALLASAYQRLNRHEDASRSYRGLAQLQPERALWWAGYGLSRDALGDATGALSAYARARQLGGLNPRVLEHINRRTLALQQAG